MMNQNSPQNTTAKSEFNKNYERHQKTLREKNMGMTNKQCYDRAAALYK